MVLEWMKEEFHAMESSVCAGIHHFATKTLQDDDFVEIKSLILKELSAEVRLSFFFSRATPFLGFFSHVSLSFLVLFFLFVSATWPFFLVGFFFLHVRKVSRILLVVVAIVTHLS